MKLFPILLLLFLLNSLTALQQPSKPRHIVPAVLRRWDDDSSNDHTVLPVDEVPPYPGYRHDPNYNTRMKPIPTNLSSDYKDMLLHVSFDFALRKGTCSRIGDQVNAKSIPQQEFPSHSGLVYDDCAWDEEGRATPWFVSKHGGFDELVEGMTLHEDEVLKIELTAQYHGAITARMHYRIRFQDMDHDFSQYRDLYEFLRIDRSEDSTNYARSFIVQSYVKYVYWETSPTKFVTDFPVIVCTATDVLSGDDEAGAVAAVAICNFDHKGRICGESSCSESAHASGSCLLATTLSHTIAEFRISEEQESYPENFRLSTASEWNFDTAIRREREIAIHSTPLPSRTRDFWNNFNLLFSLCHTDKESGEDICKHFSRPYSCDGYMIRSSSEIRPNVELALSESPFTEPIYPSLFDFTNHETSTVFIIARNLDEGFVVDENELHIEVYNEKDELVGDIMEEEDIHEHTKYCTNRDPDCDMSEHLKNMAHPVLFISFDKEGHKKYFVGGKGGFSFKINWRASYKPKDSPFNVASSQKITKAQAAAFSMVGQEKE